MSERKSHRIAHRINNLVNEVRMNEPIEDIPMRSNEETFGQVNKKIGKFFQKSDSIGAAISNDVLQSYLNDEDISVGMDMLRNEAVEAIHALIEVIECCDIYKERK